MAKDCKYIIKTEGKSLSYDELVVALSNSMSTVNDILYSLDGGKSKFDIMTEKIKGDLIIIGGAEDKEGDKEILKKLSLIGTKKVYSFLSKPYISNKCSSTFFPNSNALLKTINLNFSSLICSLLVLT